MSSTELINGVNLQLSDQPEPLLASFSVQNCSGSRNGCLACMYVTTRSLFYIGIQAGILTASFLLVQILTDNVVCSAGILIAIFIFTISRLSISKAEKISSICRFGQAICVIIAALGWVLDWFLKPVGFKIIIIICFAFLTLCTTQIHLFYLICTLNGSGSHVKGLIITVLLGTLMGGFGTLINVKTEFKIGFGIAFSIILSNSNFGSAVRDTCYYRIGRYKLLRTFTDLGRGVSYTSEDDEYTTYESHEDRISSYKLLHKSIEMTSLSILGFMSSISIWGLTEYFKVYTKFQSPLSLIISFVIGHCFAFLTEPLIVNKIKYISRITLLVYGVLEATAVILSVFKVNFGLPLIISSTTSISLISLMNIRKQTLGAKRLAATYISRALLVGLYITIGVCYILIKQ